MTIEELILLRCNQVNCKLHTYQSAFAHNATSRPYSQFNQSNIGGKARDIPLDTDTDRFTLLKHNSVMSLSSSSPPPVLKNTLLTLTPPPSRRRTTIKVQLPHPQSALTHATKHRTKEHGTHLAHALDVRAHILRGPVRRGKVSAHRGDVLALRGALEVDDHAALFAGGRACYVDVCESNPDQNQSQKVE